MDSFKKSYMWNPSLCECECNKASKIDEYLDTKNFAVPKTSDW